MLEKRPDDLGQRCRTLHAASAASASICAATISSNLRGFGTFCAVDFREELACMCIIRSAFSAEPSACLLLDPR